MLTSIRSQQRWGHSSFQQRKFTGAWEVQMIDVCEVVSVLLDKQRKTESSSGQITTSDQD